MKGLEVAKIIESADAIIIDDNLLVYPSIHENEELYNMDIDVESGGLEYQYSIVFGKDDNIEIKDNKFLLREEFDEYVTVQILTTVKIN